MALAAFFLLASYEFVRSPANSLFKAAYGAEHLPHIMALVPLCAVALLYGYGHVLSRLGPRLTLHATTLVCGAFILACFVALRHTSQAATAVLYVWRELYVVLLLEQYWSFINSSLSAEQARQLNGPICGVASLGSVCGGFLVHRLAPVWGTSAMLLCGVALLLPAGLGAAMAYRLAGEPKPTPEKHGPLALRMFAQSRFLRLLLLAVISTQVVATALDLHFQTALQVALPNIDAQTAYSGRFFALMALAAAVLQFVVAPWALRYVPRLALHLSLPLLHIGTLCVALLAPGLATIGLSYFVFKAVDYSLFRAAKETLYVPLSFDERYRAKEIIDVFGYRAGKGATAAVLAIVPLMYAATALGAAAIWAVAMVGALSSKTLKT